MNFSYKRAALFILAFVATMQIIMVFKFERLIRTVEEFEPVVVKPMQDTVESTIKLKMELDTIKVPDTTKTPEVTKSPELVKIPEVTEVTEVIEVPEIVETVELQPRIDCSLDDETQQMIVEKCKEYDIDFSFAMAVIFKESSFRPEIISKSNDYGLMQINKINHKSLSEQIGITDFLDPEQNVTAGLYMLNNLFDKYEDPAKVLMAYNMGENGAKRLWNKGIYTTDYAEEILQQADIYKEELTERMG